jgi:murein L,D-transpeptidase YafK
LILFLSALIIFFLTPLASGQTTFKQEQDQYPRVHQARHNREDAIDSLFQKLDLDYPPEQVILTAYKKEQILQLWARPDTGDAFVLVKQYPFTAFSGVLGPKRRQGDLQIPEGLYHLNHFNPYSNFHLSMKVSYPNKSDSILGKKGSLGNEIRIHGSCVTIGCIPIGDAAIEELYIVCVDVRSAGQQKIPVYIFPGKMDNQSWPGLLTVAGQDTNLIRFWYNLRQGHDIFLTTRKKLEYRVSKQGEYVFTKPTGPPNLYPWFDNASTRTLCDAIEPPPGFMRQYTIPCSFEDWLRHLPVKPVNAKVYLYNGTEKDYQAGHFAVIDIDTGREDLQQCADAIIRLYAEYLFSKRKYNMISFDLTNGDEVCFRKWITGFRPTVSGNIVTWQRTAAGDSSYSTFRAYLRFIFMYAGTYSLSRQAALVNDLADMKTGDIFIDAGFPGHAVLVTDVAENPRTGEKVFLLSQSFMPAQDIHVLRNLDDQDIDPWYRAGFPAELSTPQWTFHRQCLKRFIKE